jgi:hypothetical protein
MMYGVEISAPVQGLLASHYSIFMHRAAFAQLPRTNLLIPLLNMPQLFPTRIGIQCLSTSGYKPTPPPGDVASV